MALDPDVIGEAALAIVQQAGLAGLTMRGVSTALGVAPGALYWHVESKQELLALLAARILAAAPFADGSPVAPGAEDGAALEDGRRDVRRLAHDLRASLLGVRDGAEIVSFARALRPDSPAPHAVFEAALAGPAGAHAAWAARTIVHFILGSVAEEQNRAELVRAGITEADSSDAAEAFRYGVDVILAGVGLR